MSRMIQTRRDGWRGLRQKRCANTHRREGKERAKEDEGDGEMRRDANTERGRP